MPDRLQQRNMKARGDRQIQWSREQLNRLILATVSGAAVVTYVLEFLAGYCLLELANDALDCSDNQGSKAGHSSPSNSSSPIHR